jgi:hypothetical protein
MAKKFNFDTIKEMTREAQIKAIMFLVFAILLVVIGVSMGTQAEGGMAKIIGLLIGLGGGGWLGYTVYTIVTDRKNEKKCNVSFWTEHTNIKKPTGDDFEEEEDITECAAQIKAQYDGYAGVWIKPAQSPTATGNVDVVYFPGDSESYTATKDSNGGRVLARKADKKKDQKALTVTVSGGTVTSPSSPP